MNYLIFGFGLVVGICLSMAIHSAILGAAHRKPPEITTIKHFHPDKNGNRHVEIP